MQYFPSIYARIIHYRTALVGSAALCYVALFVLLYPLVGITILPLAVIPVAATGWLYGVWKGMLAVVLVSLLNIVLLNGMAAPGMQIVLVDGIPGTLMLLLIGIFTGWVGRLLAQIYRQAETLRRDGQLLSDYLGQIQRTEARLRASEARFRTLIDDLHVGVVFQNERGEILIANPAALKMLGTTEDRLLGSAWAAHVWDVVYPDGNPFPEVQQLIPQVIATGHPVRDVVVGIYRPASHDRAWLLVNAEPALDAAGQLQSVTCTLIDISSRVHAEATLRLHDAIMGAVSYAAAQFLDTADWHEVIHPVLARLGMAAQVSRVYIFENLPEGGDDIVTSQRYEWVAAGIEPQIGNPELLHFAYGATGFLRWAEAFSRHEVIYGDVGTFPAAERELLTRHQIRSIVVVPIIVEQRWWGHIGFDQCDIARVWLASDIEALRAAAGILGAAIEHEHAEANLRASEQRFRSLFAAARRQAQDLALLDQLHSGLAREIDLSAITRFSVEAIAATLGYTQAGIFLLEGDQIVLQHTVGYAEALPITRFPVTKGVIGQVVRTATPALVPDVRESPAFFGVIEGITSEVCVPLFAQGEVIGALNVESTSGVVFGQDDLRLMLTLAGHISIAIERAQLYTRVRENERKMLESQKLESLGVLAGGIAHDFNNLLMAIMGNTELLMLDLLPTHPGSELLSQIQIATRRAADLTGQMLAYAGKARFVVQPVDLNLLVEEITALLQVSIAKTTNLRYNLSAQLPLLEGDATQLRQVMMNLVLNAAEAIGERAGLIKVSTGTGTLASADLASMRIVPEQREGSYVFLEVADNGAGMDAETQAKIFDPFFTTKFTGRGLGLAAVLGIVRGHHGGLMVQSSVGQGTTFTVYFPILPELPALARPADATTAPPLASLKQTVLVVDDEIGVRTVAVSLLQRAGIHVMVASDGQAGVEMFRANASAIGTVLLDLTMPHMSGEEALRQIRAIRPNVHVVIMSGYDEADLQSRFAGLAPVEFLQKPFTAQLLYSKLPPRQAVVHSA